MAFLSAAISRVTTRNSFRAVHKCTCQAHYSPEEPDTPIEYCEGDQFSDVDDRTILGHLDQDDADDAADSDWDEQATLTALLDEEYVKHALPVQPSEAPCH